MLMPLAPTDAQSPAREGVALLQGLVLCGRCGRRMTVRYHVRQGQEIPDYVCQREGIQSAQSRCQTLSGGGIDEAITRIVLEAVTPASLEVALQVFEELRTRKEELDRLRRAQVERVREQAELAQRQYLLARPENRLVVDTLERQWNEKLELLAQAQEEYARAVKTQGPHLTEQAREHIQALAQDLPRVWKDPRTLARDRKRMLRLLIEDVTLTREKAIRIQIRWKGGATTSIEHTAPLNAPDRVRTSAEIVEQVRALATERTDEQIAATLNARWLRSGRGKPFTRLIIKHLRHTYGIESYAQHLRGRGWLTAPEIAAPMGVHFKTAKYFAFEGLLRAIRADGRGELLFEPPVGPLLHAQPGKRLRDRRRYPQLAPYRPKEVQYEA